MIERVIARGAGQDEETLKNEEISAVGHEMMQKAS